MTALDPKIVKEVFQKHGLTEPCPFCKDNHVPASTWRDQEKRCRANIRRTCECCKPCSGLCDGLPVDE
jgi:hypothetical protein